MGASRISGGEEARIVYICNFSENPMKQERIPVGCVSPTAVAVCWGSATVHAGIHPQVWAWTPPGVGLDTPWPDSPTSPLALGLDTPQSDPPTYPLGLGLDTPLARPPNLPPGPRSRHPLPWTEFLTHASENITFPQLLCIRY